MDKYTFIRLDSSHAVEIQQYFLNPVAHFLGNPNCSYPQAPNYYEELINESENFVYGIEYQETLIACMFFIELEKNSYQLKNLFLQKEFRGQSLSKKLIEFGIKKLSKNSHIQTYIHQHQREQIHLFKDLAFVQKDKIEFEFEGKAETFHNFNFQL